MANSNLSQAKQAKNDEFYTQWRDIERELQAYLDSSNSNVFRGKTILCPCDDPEWSNFTKFFALHFKEYGLKKLVSTSYAFESKTYKAVYQPSLFEQRDSKFDKDKTLSHGKLFVLDRQDVNRNGKINIEDLKWNYLSGDGDFRSKEVRKLRDEGPSPPPCATIDDHSMNRRSKEDPMSIFNNGTGKFLADAFDRGITSIKDFFDIDQNAKREETHKLEMIQDDEESVKNEEEEHTSFFSNLFGSFFGGDSSNNSGNDLRDDTPNYGGRDPGRDMQDAYDRQERDDRQREDYERQSRNDDER